MINHNKHETIYPEKSPKPRHVAELFEHDATQQGAKRSSHHENLRWKQRRVIS
jgi:hypothetical protein